MSRLNDHCAALLLHAPVLGQGSGFAEGIDRLCLDALHREIMSWPKPGLVTPRDSGSHSDMDVNTFLASIAALTGSFAAMVDAGGADAEFCDLQSIGIDAEAVMLAATGGVNTHRGAIFNLGLLAAAAGLRRENPAWSGLGLGEIVARRWGEAILASRPVGTGRSHGERVFSSHGVGGARAEAAAGFPTVYGAALPCLHGLLAQGADQERALVGALLALMARVEDSNLVWRGGGAGLEYVWRRAATFNADGGVMQHDWREQLQDFHDALVARRLSPGGSADLTAVAWLLHVLEPER
ncbi:triphosphoribosyl-dephospho-CoA synthase MdcB [Denitratisoma sp. agr-D3]